MNCCSPINVDTGRVFSRFAGLHRVRFRLLGFERTQRQLLQGIKAAGLEHAELLEVGCGPGYLHQALLRAGAARAIGVDLSAGMLDLARAAAEAGGLAQRTDYRLGDFVALADRLPDADITILDKVVCCYPDWQALLDRSLAKTRRFYALTYPRDRGLTRLGVSLMGWGLGSMGCCYQPYLHDPKKIQARIVDHGFRMFYSALTFAWHTQVFERTAP